MNYERFRAIKIGLMPKWLSVLGAVSLIFLFLSNKAVHKIPHLDWGLAAVVSAGLSLVILRTLRLHVGIARVLILPLLWLLVALSTTPIYEHVNHHLHNTLFTITLTVMASSLVLTAFSVRNPGRIVFFLSALWIVANLFMLIGYLAGFVEYQKYFSGFFENRNSFSIQTVVAVALLITFCRPSFKVKLLVLTAFFEVLVSLSITGFISFVFVAAYSVWKHYRSTIRVALTFAIVLGIAALLAFPNPFSRRVYGYAQIFIAPEKVRPGSTPGASTFYRSWLFITGIKQFAERPLLGHGVDTARFYLIPPTKRYEARDRGPYAHSNYVEILVDAGAIGCVLHYLPLIWAMWHCRISHPYRFQVRMFGYLYLLLGLTAVTYRQFSTIFLYVLVIFLWQAGKYRTRRVFGFEKES